MSLSVSLVLASGHEMDSFTLKIGLFISIVNLPTERRLKVILHELGHLEHDPNHYEHLCEKYEAQANRNMICGLLENESLDDFNYVRFMKKYNLTTICDETFIKNEYLKLIET